MPAIWNSYSKSETARRPRRTMRASTECTKSISSEENPMTLTLVTVASTSRAMAMRSAVLNSGRLLSLSAIATITSSNMRAARRTRSS